MSDWTDAEHKKMNGLRIERDPNHPLEIARQKANKEHPVVEAFWYNKNLDNLTDYVNWSHENVTMISPVNRQGRSCGSCWAFVAAGAIETQYALTQNLSLKQISVQQLLDCTNEKLDGCEGGKVGQAHTYAK